MPGVISPTVDPMFQNRPLSVWLREVYQVIANRTDDELARCFRQGLADNHKSIKTGDWHPDVVDAVTNRMILLLRQDSEWVEDWVKFALCTARYWSDEALARLLAYQAGQAALQEYVQQVQFGRVAARTAATESSEDTHDATKADTDVDSASGRGSEPASTTGTRMGSGRDSSPARDSTHAMGVSPVSRPDKRSGKVAAAVSRKRQTGRKSHS